MLNADRYENYLRDRGDRLFSQVDKLTKENAALRKAIKKFVNWKFSKQYDSRSLNVMCGELKSILRKENG